MSIGHMIRIFLILNFAIACFSTLANEIGESIIVQPDGLPPNRYMEVELISATKEQVLGIYGSTPDSGMLNHDRTTGLCYRSAQGNYAAFGLGRSIFVIEISTDKVAYQCTQTELILDSCLGKFCLGDSRSKVEIILGATELVKVNDLEVAYYSYTQRLAESKLSEFEKFKMTEYSVIHNLLFKFKNNLVTNIGVLKIEDLP